MSGFFYEILYRPLFNALVLLYQSVGFKDLGISIILLTVIIRLILYPLFYKSYHHQKVLQNIQPEIKKIQALHKDNKEKQAQAMMDLYKAHKVNPFSGLLLILVQLPVLIALYKVFYSGFTDQSLAGLYNFISVPAGIGHTFLGLLDLAKPHIIIVGLAAIAQYFQGRLALQKPAPGVQRSQAEIIGKQMVFVGPILSLVILYRLPAAVSLYWLATSVFSCFQQIAINRSFGKKAAMRKQELEKIPNS